MREAAEGLDFDTDGIGMPVVVDRVSPDADEEAKAKAREAYIDAALEREGRWSIGGVGDDNNLNVNGNEAKKAPLGISRVNFIVNDKGGISRSSLSNPKRTPQLLKESDDIVASKTESVKNTIREYRNGDKKVVISSRLADTLNSLRRFFGMRYEGRSNYVVLLSTKGTVCVRLSDHNAFGDNFKKDNADACLSIYIEGVTYTHRKSDIPYTEYRITNKNFQENPKAVVDGIVYGIEHLINTGEYIDGSGLAEKMEYPEVDEPLGKSSLGDSEYKVFRMANESKWHLIDAQLSRLPDGTYAKDGETRPTRKLPVGEWYGLTESGTGIVSGMFKSKISVTRKDGTEVQVPIDLWDKANAEFLKEAGIGGTEFASRNRWYYPHAERVDLRGKDVYLYRNDYGPAYASVLKDRVNPSLGKFSLTSLAQAAGMSVDLENNIPVFNLNGQRVERKGGKAYADGKEVTFADVRSAMELSPVAALLRNTRDRIWRRKGERSRLGAVESKDV